MSLGKARNSFGGGISASQSTSSHQRNSGVPLVKKYESLATKKDHYYTSTSVVSSSKVLSSSSTTKAAGGKLAATTTSLSAMSQSSRPSLPNHRGSAKTANTQLQKSSPSNAYARAFVPAPATASSARAPHQLSTTPR